MSILSQIKQIIFILKYSDIGSSFYKLLSILFLFASILSYVVWAFYLNDSYDEVTSATTVIDKHISIVYNEGSRLASWVGNKIANSNYKDQNVVAQILQKYNAAHDIRIHSSISWPSLSWTNAKGIIIANQKYGVLSDRNIDLNVRSCIQNSRLQQWQLYISRPDHSLVDNQFIIPIAMGITDPNNNLAGFIGFGFNMENLLSTISSLVEKHMQFVIYDENGQIYVTSDKSLLGKVLSFHKYITRNLKSDEIFEKIYDGDNIYLYHTNLSYIPGIISIGYNKKFYYTKMLVNIGIIASIFFFVGITCLFLILYTTTMLIKTTNDSLAAKKQFTTEIISHFTNTVLSMLKQCDNIAIINNYSSNKTKFFKSIGDVASSIKALYLLSTYNLTPSLYNLNDLIKEAIQIKYSEILAKNITISTKFQERLPKILVDNISIKQIISSIIFHIINSNSVPSHISMITYSKLIGSKIEVFLEFRNIKNDIINICLSKNFSNSRLKIYDYTNMEMLHIRKLIEHNKCELIIDITKNVVRIKFAT